MFRQYVPAAVHGTKVRANFFSKAYEAEHLYHITCDNARLYMMQLYFVVRIHHVLHEHNRHVQRPGS